MEGLDKQLVLELLREVQGQQCEEPTGLLLRARLCLRHYSTNGLFFPSSLYHFLHHYPDDVRSGVDFDDLQTHLVLYGKIRVRLETSFDQHLSRWRFSHSIDNQR